MNSTIMRRAGNPSFVRYKLGLSQQQLADSLCVSRSTIAMVETGKRKLSGSAALIYLNMCKTAAVLNPGAGIVIKRGRKPGRSGISSVTNYCNCTGKSSNEDLVAVLRGKKEKLRYQLTGLQFKERAMEEKAKRLSDQLVVATALRKASAALLDKLPEGRLYDKYELRAAVLYAKQLKLQMQLRKCSPVALLQIEFQSNLLEKQILLAEAMMAAFNTGKKGAHRIPTPGALLIAA